MIIRIFTEGQYELPDFALPLLHQLDGDAQSALDSGDPQRFHADYEQLLDHIRREGTPLSAEDLRGSELMLPPPDISLREATAEFHGHDLIPG